MNRNDEYLEGLDENFKLLFILETKVSNLDLDDASEKESVASEDPIVRPKSNVRRQLLPDTGSGSEDEGTYEINCSSERGFMSDYDSSVDQSTIDSSYYPETETEAETEAETDDRTLSHESLTSSEKSLHVGDFDVGKDNNDENPNKTFDVISVKPDENYSQSVNNEPIQKPRTPIEIDKNVENLIKNDLVYDKSLISTEVQPRKPQNENPIQVVKTIGNQQPDQNSSNESISRPSSPSIGSRLALRLEGTCTPDRDGRFTTEPVSEPITSAPSGTTIVPMNPRRSTGPSDRRQNKAKELGKTKARDPSPFPTQKQTFTFDTSILKRAPPNYNPDKEQSLAAETVTNDENPRSPESSYPSVVQAPSLRLSRSEPPSNFKSSATLPMKNAFPSKPSEPVPMSLPPPRRQKEPEKTRAPKAKTDRGKVNAAATFLSKTIQGEIEKERSTPTSVSEYSASEATSSTRSSVEDLFFFSGTPTAPGRKLSYELGSAELRSPLENPRSRRSSAGSSSPMSQVNYYTVNRNQTPQSQNIARKSPPNFHKAPTQFVPISQANIPNQIFEYQHENDISPATKRQSLLAFYGLTGPPTNSPKFAHLVRRLSEPRISTPSPTSQRPPSRPVSTNLQSIGTPSSPLVTPRSVCSPITTVNQRSVYSPGSSNQRIASSPTIYNQQGMSFGTNQRAAMSPSPINQRVVSSPVSANQMQARSPVQFDNSSSHAPVFAQTLSSGSKATMPRTRSMDTVSIAAGGNSPSPSSSSGGINMLDKYVEKLVKSRSSEPPNFGKPKAQSPIPVGFAHKQVRVPPSQSNPDFVSIVHHDDSNISMYDNKSYGQPQLSFGFSRFDQSSPMQMQSTGSRSFLNFGQQNSPSNSHISDRSFENQGNMPRNFKPVNISLPVENQSFHNFSVSRNVMKNTQFRIQKDCIQVLSPEDGREATIHRNSNSAPVEIQIGNGGVNISFGGGPETDLLGTELGAVYPMRRSSNNSRISLNSVQSDRFQSVNFMQEPDDDYL